MKPPRTYTSPEPFKQALEQRLKTSSKSGADFTRRRQLLVFDRFLARVVATVGDSATLKGGLVLELRLERARTTKDVDLRMVGSPDDLLAKLQNAGRARVADARWGDEGSAVIPRSSARGRARCDVEPDDVDLDTRVNSKPCPEFRRGDCSDAV